MRKKIAEFVRGLHREQQGLTTVEYAIVLCLIAAVSVGTWQSFGSKLKSALSTALTTITTPVAAAATGAQMP